MNEGAGTADNGGGKPYDDAYSASEYGQGWADGYQARANEERDKGGLVGAFQDGFMNGYDAGYKAGIATKGKDN